MPFSNQKGEGFETDRRADRAKRRCAGALPWFPQATGFLRNTLRARRCDIVIGMVSGAELVLSTNPYYRSTYVMVTRKKDGITADRLDDPALKSLKVGLIAGTPPAGIAVRNGLMAHATPYRPDGRHALRFAQPSHGERLGGGPDRRGAAMGPLAGYFAASARRALAITPLVHEAKADRMRLFHRHGRPPGRAPLEARNRSGDRRKQGPDPATCANTTSR